MSRVVHFVIAVDIDNKEVMIDDDTYTAKFPYGGLYDTEATDGDGWRKEDFETEYLPALELLNNTKLRTE